MAEDSTMQGDIQISPMGVKPAGAKGKQTSPIPTAQAPAAAGVAAAAAPAAPLPGAPIGLEEEALLSAQQALAPPEKYAIPMIVREKFPDLIDLIKTTESMDEDERDYWFQILPIMTEEQISKFRDILVSEKDQLARLDQEYEQELSKLNEKHMIEWKEFETKEKRAEIETKEKKAEEEEKAAEEELLKRLQGV